MSASRALAALALLLGGCAWSNRDNRPVWNAFEEHVVPEDDLAFALTLPLSVPGGLGAILLDSFVVHPAQVVDDAAGDARDVWKGVDWAAKYYTELAALPARAIGTPIVFAGSFLGRSLFDIDPRAEPASPGEALRREQDRRGEAQREVLRWLESLRAGRTDPAPPLCADCLAWSDALQSAFDATRRDANAVGRLELYHAAEASRWPPWQADPTMGLRDSDPVVRYMVLLRWSPREPIPEELLRDLRSDPSEMVRLLAQTRFPAPD